MEEFTPDMEQHLPAEHDATIDHTADLQNLITLLGKASTLMGKAQTVVDHGKEALPQVQEKLHNISNANEEAALSIMNETETIGEFANSIQRHVQSSKVAITDIHKLLEDARSTERTNSDEHIRNYVEVMHNALCAYELSIVQSLSAIAETIEHVRRSASSIAMILQVQDITSQQLAGAGQMVNNVQTNLKHMFSTNKAENVHPETQRDGSFNPDAKFDSSVSRQSAVDDLFNQINQNLQG